MNVKRIAVGGLLALAPFAALSLESWIYTGGYRWDSKYSAYALQHNVVYTNGAACVLAGSDAAVSPVGVRRNRYANGKDGVKYALAKVPKGYTLDKWVLMMNILADPSGAIPNSLVFPELLANARISADPLEVDSNGTVTVPGDGGLRDWAEHMLIAPCFKWLDYDLAYFKNDGSTESKSGSRHSYIDEVTLDGCDWKRIGRSFDGWATASSATKPEFQAGATVTGEDLSATTAGVDLYAVWTATNMTIRLDANGGTVSPSTAAAVIDGTYSLPTPVREHYDFAGWYTEDKKAIANGDKVGRDDICTLTANWTLGRHQLTIGNATPPYGSVNPSGVQSYTYGQTANLRATPVEGCRFVEWSDGDTNAYRTVSVLSNATYWARFAMNEGGETHTLDGPAEREESDGTIYFLPNGGEGTMAPQKTRPGESAALSPNAFENKFISSITEKTDGGGFETNVIVRAFCGWSTNPDAGPDAVMYADGAEVVGPEPDDYIALYAIWSAIAEPGCIAFDANGGEGEMEDVSAYDDDVVYLPWNKFTKAGYAFAGWATNGTAAAVFEDGDRTEGLAVPGATNVLKATWSPNEYAVYFDANGGLGVVANKTVAYGEAFSLPSGAALTRTGYAFLGWANETSATAPDYAGGASVSSLATEGYVVLHAVWAEDPSALPPEECEVYFCANGGLGAMDSQTLVKGTATNLSASAFSREGYDFAGWAKSANAASAEYADEESVDDIGESDWTVLYAVWTEAAAAGYGELSEAVDANFELISTNCWTVTTETNLTAPSCLKMPTAIGFGTEYPMPEVLGQTAVLTGTVSGPGTLSFNWRCDKNGDNWASTSETEPFCAFAVSTNAAAATLCYSEKIVSITTNTYGQIVEMVTNKVAVTDWQPVAYEVASGGETTFYWVGQKNNIQVWLDDVTWTPSESEDVPESALYVVRPAVADGTEKTCVFAIAGCTVTDGIVSATEPGEYEAELTLKDGYAWADDETNATRTVQWSIAAQAEKVRALFVVDSPVADGTEKTGVVAVAGCTVTGGDASATAPGEYTATLALMDGYAWADEETNATRNVSWTLAAESGSSGGGAVTPGGQGVGVVGCYHVLDSLVYDGSEQTGVTAVAGCTVVDAAATIAGTFRAVATLANGADRWFDGGKESKRIVEWTIAKGEYDLSDVSFTDAVLLEDGEPKSIFIDGELPDGVTVSYEGNGQTGSGTFSVTAKFTGDADNYEAITGTLTATMTIVSAFGPDGTDEPTADELPAGAVSVFDVTAEADGAAHGLDAEAIGEAFAPYMKSGEKPMYSTDGGKTWTEEAPAFTDAGTYSVLYRVVLASGKTFTHEALVTITEASGGGGSGGGEDDEGEGGDSGEGGGSGGGDQPGPVDPEPTLVDAILNESFSATLAEVAGVAIPANAKVKAYGLAKGLKVKKAGGVWSVTGKPKELMDWETRRGWLVVTVGKEKSLVQLNMRVLEAAGVEPSAQNPACTVVPKAMVAEDGVVELHQAIACSWKVEAASGATVKAKGLPSGLKLQKTTSGYVVQGVPKKAGAFVAVFTAKYGSATSVSTCAIAVDGLPAWLVGKFNGGGDGGIVALSVAKSGRISGKWQVGGAKLTLKATAFASYASEPEPSYTAELTAKGAAVTAVFTEGGVGGYVVADGFEAWRSVWKDDSWKAIGKRIGKRTVSYTNADGEGEYTVELAIGANGSVKVKGVFIVNGKRAAVSCTTALCPVAAAPDGTFDAVVYVYFAPKANKLPDGYSARILLRWTGADYEVVHAGDE